MLLVNSYRLRGTRTVFRERGPRGGAISGSTGALERAVRGAIAAVGVRAALNACVTSTKGARRGHCSAIGVSDAKNAATVGSTSRSLAISGHYALYAAGGGQVAEWGVLVALAARRATGSASEVLWIANGIGGVAVGVRQAFNATGVANEATRKGGGAVGVRRALDAQLRGRVADWDRRDAIHLTIATDTDSGRGVTDMRRLRARLIHTRPVTGVVCRPARRCVCSAVGGCSALAAMASNAKGVRSGTPGVV